MISNTAILEDSLLAKLCKRNKNCDFKHPFVIKQQNAQNKTNIDEDIQNGAEWPSEKHRING